MDSFFISHSASTHPHFSLFPTCCQNMVTMKPFSPLMSASPLSGYFWVIRMESLNCEEKKPSIHCETEAATLSQSLFLRRNNAILECLRNYMDCSRRKVDMWKNLNLRCKGGHVDVCTHGSACEACLLTSRLHFCERNLSVNEQHRVELPNPGGCSPKVAASHSGLATMHCFVSSNLAKTETKQKPSWYCFCCCGEGGRFHPVLVLSLRRLWGWGESRAGWRIPGCCL